MNKLNESFYVLPGFNAHLHFNTQFDLIRFMILIFPNFPSDSLPFCTDNFLVFTLVVFELYMFQIK